MVDSQKMPAETPHQAEPFVKSFEQIMREKRERSTADVESNADSKRPKTDVSAAAPSVWARRRSKGNPPDQTPAELPRVLAPEGRTIPPIRAASGHKDTERQEFAMTTSFGKDTGEGEGEGEREGSNQAEASSASPMDPTSVIEPAEVGATATAESPHVKSKNVRSKSKWSDDESDDEDRRVAARGVSSISVSDPQTNMSSRSPGPAAESPVEQTTDVDINSTIVPSEDEDDGYDMYYPTLSGCRNVDDFERLNRVEEGTYGVVYRVRDRVSGEVMALKRLKMEKEKDGFPITALREINTLLKCKHENIVSVQEIVVGNTMDSIFIVMEFIEHDLKTLLETMKTPFAPSEVKTVMHQLLAGVHHMHDNWMLHRDLKTSNLLMSHRGILKIADFGLAREYGSPLKNYTQLVVTLWYRSPELLLGTGTYSTAVDMWSVGCIMSEVFTQKALFPAQSEIDTLKKIFKLLGTPNERIWEGFNELPAVKKVNFAQYPNNSLRSEFSYLTQRGFDLLSGLLTYDPKKRISAGEALDHDYFRESPLPQPPDMFPHWPAKSEGGLKPKNKALSPKLDDPNVGYSIEQEAAGAVYDGAAPFHLRFG